MVFLLQVKNALYVFIVTGLYTKMVYYVSSDKTMQEMKVLLVDNELDVTYAIGTVLEANGFEVDSFNDPVLVCDTYKSNYYDLVISDIKMPKMDGFQLYDCIDKKTRKQKYVF